MGDVKMAEDLFVMLSLLQSRTLKKLNYTPHPKMHRKILSSSGSRVKKRVVLQVPVHFSNMFCTYVFIYYAFITK